MPAKIPILMLAGCCIFSFPTSGNAESLYPTDGALSGITLTNRAPLAEEKQFAIGVGTGRQNEQSLHLEQMLTESFGVGVFAGQEHARSVDYDDNDIDCKTISTHLQHIRNDKQLDFILHHQRKEFGARGYYGESPAHPANEKTEDTFLSFSAQRGDLSNEYLLGSISWHEFQDDYMLPTLGFRNQTRSQTSHAFFEGRTLEINQGSLAWKTDLQNERITGDLGNHHRTCGGISLLPQWRGDHLKISVGARGEFFTDDSSAFLPQLGVEYLLSDNLTAFASYTETLRQPSYTELYYLSPRSTGNPALKPQTTQQTEIGFKGISSEFMNWETSLFHRRSKHILDWMTGVTPIRWVATDIGTLDVYGLKAQLDWYPTQTLDVQLAYAWTYKDQKATDIDVGPDSKGYASRYALDDPEHLAQASLRWHPTDTLEIETAHSLRWQTDNPVRTSSDFGVDSSFVVRFTPPQAERVTVSLLLNNAWDDDFQTRPGQRPVGRFAGVSVSIDL